MLHCHLTCGGLLALVLTTPAFSQKPLQTPPAKVSCVAKNQGYVLVERLGDGTARETEMEDFYITCTITVAEKVVYDRPLTTPHPLSWPDASVAITEFRTKRAAEILKGLKEKK